MFTVDTFTKYANRYKHWFNGNEVKSHENHTPDYIPAAYKKFYRPLKFQIVTNFADQTVSPPRMWPLYLHVFVQKKSQRKRVIHLACADRCNSLCKTKLHFIFKLSVQPAFYEKLNSIHMVFCLFQNKE